MLKSMSLAGCLPAPIFFLTPLPHFLGSAPNKLPTIEPLSQRAPGEPKPKHRQARTHAHIHTACACSHLHTYTQARACSHAPLRARVHTGTAHTGTNASCPRSRVPTRTARAHARGEAGDAVAEEPLPAPSGLQCPCARSRWAPACGAGSRQHGLQSRPCSGWAGCLTALTAPTSFPALQNAAPGLETKEKPPNDFLCSALVLLPTVLTPSPSLSCKFRLCKRKWNQKHSP